MGRKPWAQKENEEGMSREMGWNPGENKVTEAKEMFLA